MSYLKLVATRAFTETKTFWTLHKAWAFPTVPISGLLLWLLARGQGQSFGLVEVIFVIVFGLVASGIGSYGANLIRVAGLLHDEQERKIRELDRQRIALEQNLKSASERADKAEQARREHEKKLAAHPLVQQEERQLNIVRSKLSDLTSQEKGVVRYILDHGRVRYSTLLYVWKDDPKIFNSALGRATRSDLILQESAQADRWIFVNPSLESALKVVLSQE